jgi:uncharacterized surface protein with fasciclin (FAS1) repeats/DNA-binding NarL/FixJ family response regulator
MDVDHADIMVLVADRVALFRKGMISLLRETHPGWRMAEAASLNDILAQLHDLRPDLLLVDLQLPAMGGAAGLHDLHRLVPAVRMVVMAEADDRGSILQCLAAGALGYVLKSTSPAQFQRALETILAGSVFAPASLTGVAFGLPTAGAAAPTIPPPPPPVLTGRQRDVFVLLAEGCATKVIAQRLHLSVGTVKVHLAGIYRTLGARSRLEVLAKVHHAGPQPAMRPPGDAKNAGARIQSPECSVGETASQGGTHNGRMSPMQLKAFLLSAAVATLATSTALTPAHAQLQGKATLAAEHTVMVGGAPMYPSKNIVQNAVNSKDHTTLVAAVKAAGLVPTLESAGPFTVFAPTNEAFDKLPPGTVATLLKPANKPMLVNILTYHVVPGRYTTGQLMHMVDSGHGKAMLKTVEGEDLTITADNGHVYIEGAKSGVAMITVPNVMQSNGVIQVVNSVLLPN